MDKLPTFLQDAFPAPQVEIGPLTLHLVASVVLGSVVGLVYRLTHRGETAPTPSFVATLVLLCVIIAMVTQVVGDNVGRAFTLVGALSIVRFRTVVEDTRDTAFVIFAVVVGMAAGLGNLPVASIGLGVVSAVALLLFWLQPLTHRTSGDWLLHVRVGLANGSTSQWDAILAKHCGQFQLQETATAKQGAALDVTYRLKLKPGVEPLQLLNEINRLEGIQNLELKRS